MPCFAVLRIAPRRRYFLRATSRQGATRCDPTRRGARRRDGWTPPHFISRTRDYRGRVRCVERVTNSARRARHRLKYLCRKHRNLVNGLASYESRFICARLPILFQVIGGTWRMKNANVRKRAEKHVKRRGIFEESEINLVCRIFR